MAMYFLHIWCIYLNSKYIFDIIVYVIHIKMDNGFL